MTWNNYPEDWEEKLTSCDVIKYWVAGKETAPETLTPHLQMYIQLKKKQRLAPLKAALTLAGIPGVHLEKAKGTLVQNQTYCKKDGDWKDGGEATGKGRRSDVLALRDAVLSGKGDLDIAMDDSTCRASAQFARFTENLRTKHREKTAKEALTASFVDKPLKPWQAEAVVHLDVCVYPVQLVLKQYPWGGTYLEEFGQFDIHTFP